ncbi:uncharacterized protein LOC128343956 [Hemicordylus capensis]|uniref:uncharacterized protein LOC128343956 n=1 Tax=Hemicordylus capensis TaxID=884348 RepID=UPI00230357A3|nr:uncharacterized protein LOC128343956 [Hemicordylus capensis]
MTSLKYCLNIGYTIYPKERRPYIEDDTAISNIKELGKDLVLDSGPSAAASISTPHNAVYATTNQTALLSFFFQPRIPNWEFISIKWEFISINESVPILVYLLDSCVGYSQIWWERECNSDKEVAERYQQRADILKNGTLMIQHVGTQDSGKYQAIVRTYGKKDYATVNLIVIEDSRSIAAPSLTLGRLETESIIRVILACLVLCCLGLVVGQHIYTLEASITQERKTVGQPGKSNLYWS